MKANIDLMNRTGTLSDYKSTISIGNKKNWTSTNILGAIGGWNYIPRTNYQETFSNPQSRRTANSSL